MKHWIRTHPLVTTVALIVLIVGPGYWRLEVQNDRIAAQAAQSCQDRRNGRLILRELVELSDDGRGAINLTGLDSFDELDPATQQYLRDLEEASRQAPRPSEFVRSALALLDVPTCD